MSLLCLVTDSQFTLTGPGHLVFGSFSGFHLILRTVPTYSWQLFIPLFANQDFVTVRFKQARVFKLIKMLISKKIIRIKGQSWVNNQFRRNYLKQRLTCGLIVPEVS